MAWPRPPQVLVEAVKRAGAVVGLVAVGPLLLAAPVVVVAAAQAATACSTGGLPAVDAAAVARQVEAVLAGEGGGDVAVPGLDDPAEQVPHARTIQATGVAQGVPARGQVVALAAALQESRLRNLAFGDRDSLGLFQQRPSQGWGTPGQILDPVYASTRFYERLLAVDGWAQLTVAQAAQAVQGSALPDAYARWELLAVALQEALAPSLPPAGDNSPSEAETASEGPASGGGGGLGGCVGAVGGDGSGFGSIPPGVLPDGYQIPAAAPARVRTAIRWALGQLGTPYQWGGTCVDPHGPDPMGRCDCSSLMQQSYAAAGVELSRTTFTQVEDGRSARLGALEPGDLLFTRGAAAAPEHVGMLIGSGLVVHAPRPGAVVRIGTLADWRADVLAARRIVS